MIKRIYMLLVLLLWIVYSSSCTIVKYRLFRDEMKFIKLDKWSVGAPLFIALRGVSDRKLWDRNYYWTEVPIKYENDEYSKLAREYIKSGAILIDTLNVTYLSTNESVSLAVIISKLDGKPIVNTLQDYDDDPACFSFDSLYIPPQEDSIKVDFVVKVRDITDSAEIKTPFSFILYRYEKTRPGIWGGI